MKEKIQKLIPIGVTIFIAAVFIDSLRFKFTNHPNTEKIFGILNDWAGTFGASGLFAHSGIFSAYVIGSFELLASALLLAALVPAFKKLRIFGALLAAGIMTGAISFHLFTPLGIDPNNDGGGLFVAACLVWVSSLVLVYLERAALFRLLQK